MTHVAAPARRLSRGADGRPAAPVRIVHLGVGNFFRAHQAWYTEHADDAEDWGIAAFTGHSRRTADESGGGQRPAPDRSVRQRPPTCRSRVDSVAVP